MGFKLYYAGSKQKEADQVIEEKKLPRLLSYLNDKTHLLGRHEKGLVTFVDSGAFSAHSKGAEVDVDSYISYLNEYDETISICAQLDKIPGELGKVKTVQQLQEAPELSWENYLYMVERLKSPEKLLPIFHQGEDFKHLVRMLEHTPKIEYIGLSPANDRSNHARSHFLNECFKIIKASSNPNVKTHAFGMTNLSLLEKFPIYSADSTSWVIVGANGNIMTEFGVLFVSDGKLRRREHIKGLPPAMYERVVQYVEERGFDFEDLKTSYQKRILFNLHYLMEWAENYEYKPVDYDQFKLF